KEGKGFGFGLVRRPQARSESDGGRGHPQRPLRGGVLRPRRAGGGRWRGYFSQGNCCRDPEPTVLFLVVPRASQPGDGKEKGESSVLGPGSVRRTRSSSVCSIGMIPRTSSIVSPPS